MALSTPPLFGVGCIRHSVLGATPGQLVIRAKIPGTVWVLPVWNHPKPIEVGQLDVYWLSLKQFWTLWVKGEYPTDAHIHPEVDPLYGVTLDQKIDPSWDWPNEVFDKIFAEFEAETKEVPQNE